MSSEHNGGSLVFLGDYLIQEIWERTGGTYSLGSLFCIRSGDFTGMIGFYAFINASDQPAAPRPFEWFLS